MSSEQTPSEGRVVRYVIGIELDGEPRCVPAIVVRAWNAAPRCGLNLQVFVDGANDHTDRYWLSQMPDGAMVSRHNEAARNAGAEPVLNSYAPNKDECLRGQMWRTSVAYSDEKQPGTWHWPERA